MNAMLLWWACSANCCPISFGYQSDIPLNQLKILTSFANLHRVYPNRTCSWFQLMRTRYPTLIILVCFTPRGIATYRLLAFNTGTCKLSYHHSATSSSTFGPTSTAQHDSGLKVFTRGMCASDMYSIGSSTKTHGVKCLRKCSWSFNLLPAHCAYLPQLHTKLGNSRSFVP